MGLHPSYWQQIVAGLAVVVPTLVVGGFLLGWLTRSVLEPRVAGRRWPEGARALRPFVELIVDGQRRAVVSGGRPGAEDRLVWAQAVRFGIIVGSCAVIPVSTGLVLTRPGLGLYVMAVLLVVDAVVHHAVGDRDPDTRDRLRIRIGLAALVAAVAGVVHAQWGTASVAAVVVAQAGATAGTSDLWGLPTFAVHPAVCAVAVAAMFAVVTTMADEPVHRVGALPGLLAGLVDGAWMVAIAAWLVAAFGGGGAVPWPIDNPGTRHVVSVAVFVTKVTVVAVVLAWARARWPRLRVRSIRLLLAVGAVVCGVSLAVTLVIRHFA